MRTVYVPWLWRWSGQCCHQIQIVITRRRSEGGDPPPPPSTSSRSGHRPGNIHYTGAYILKPFKTMLQNIFLFFTCLQFASTHLASVCLQFASASFNLVQYGSFVLGKSSSRFCRHTYFYLTDFGCQNVPFTR